MTYQERSCKRFYKLLIGLALALCILVYLAIGPFEPPSAAADLASPATSAAPSDKCVVCHTNVGVLQAMAVDQDVSSMAGTSGSLAGELSPLQPGEGALVNEEFLSSVHNAQGCIGCHGGVPDIINLDAAHEGMLRDPLEESDSACAMCHPSETEVSATGLHQTLSGFRTALAQRGADLGRPEMQDAYSNHCETCHTTCGQCHISRPTVQQGGLLQGHEVSGAAPVSDTCAGCHGARVVNEYQGGNEGVGGSVHWQRAAMDCSTCHAVDQLHGDDTEVTHRYDGERGIDCLECHQQAALEQTGVQAHLIHEGKLDCYVCHVSGPYQNCYDCHVGQDAEGVPYYQVADSEMDFKIGRNPTQSEDRPWEYILLRHVPVVPDTFAYYGEELLPSFDSVPTWKYTTPHNIQKITPQNQSCEHCHGNPDVFLLAEDLRPEEELANVGVVVDRVPGTPHPGLSTYDIPTACMGCHPRAEEWDWELLNASIHSLDYVVEPAGTVIECDDCHSPEGNFDWAAAGFSDEEAGQLSIHPGLSEYDIPAACTGCHPGAAEADWGVLNDSIHSLDYVVEPAGTVIECEDCHSPEGAFDWSAAGFSDQEKEELTWSGYPAIESSQLIEEPSTGPWWVLGVGVVVAVGVMTPLFRNRPRGQGKGS